MIDFNDRQFEEVAGLLRPKENSLLKDTEFWIVILPALALYITKTGTNETRFFTKKRIGIRFIIDPPWTQERVSSCAK